MRLIGILAAVAISALVASDASAFGRKTTIINNGVPAQQVVVKSGILGRRTTIVNNAVGGGYVSGSVQLNVNRSSHGASFFVDRGVRFVTPSYVHHGPVFVESAPRFVRSTRVLDVQDTCNGASSYVAPSRLVAPSYMSQVQDVTDTCPPCPQSFPQQSSATQQTTTTTTTTTTTVNGIVR